MPRTAAPSDATQGELAEDTTADSAPNEAVGATAMALEQALSVLRERVAVVDQIVASSPARDAPSPTPPMHTPLGSPAQTPMATPMEAPPHSEQDVRIQTTVLSDAEIAEMVAQGTAPSAPTSAQKLRGLGAKLAGSLVALSPARTAAAPSHTSDVTKDIANDNASPTERMRLENCRERGLPDTATWNEIADYDMALSPKDIEERRKDTVGRLLQLATTQDEGSPQNMSAAAEQTRPDIQQASREPDTHATDEIESEPQEILFSPEPSQGTGESELSELLDDFQVIALATPAALPSALPSAPTNSTPEAQDTPESGTPSCGDTRGSSDSFGSVQSGSFLNDSCSPVGVGPVRRAGAGRRRGGSIDAALAMLPGTPREYDMEDDVEGEGAEEEADDEAEDEEQMDQVPEDSRGDRIDHMDISLHSFVPPSAPENQHDASSVSLSPSMAAAQCVLDGDHIGAQLALASVFGSSDVVESARSSLEADTSASALEDSFAMAEAEAMQQAEESFAAKHAALEDSFVAAEEEADKSPGDAVCSAFGDDFGQLLAEARQLVGTGQRVASPFSTPHSPQKLGSQHSQMPAAASTSPSNVAVDEDEPIVTEQVDEANAGPSEATLRVGEDCEVILQGTHQTGTICFLGPAPLLGIGQWAGIKLDHPCGKHDGSVHGKRYFKCKARHGVLLKQERVKPSLGRPDVAEGPVTRSQTAAAAAKVASKTNRFMQRASEQVQAATSDPSSPLHGSDIDFSELVAEARQLAGEVELSELRRSTIQSPAATPSQLSAKKQATRATRRRSSVDTTAAAAAAAVAAETVAMPTPEHAAEAEAEVYLLKRKLRKLWKDMGRQSLRRVLNRSCPSGEVQFDDFLQSLRIGGHINAKLVSDLELRRLFRGAKLQSCGPGITVSSHDITPLAVDSLVSFLGLENTHAELKQKVADATGTDVDATTADEDGIDFTALLREAREVIGAIPVAKSPPTTTATVATASTGRNGKPRAIVTATATARIAVGVRSGLDEPSSARVNVDHSKPKQKQPRRPLSAPKQRYVPPAAKSDGRTSSTARANSRGPTRSRTPDARRHPASSSRAGSNSRGRRASSASRGRPSTAPAPPQVDATKAMVVEERTLDASPKELSYAERALEDAQRRQAWLAKQQEAQQERARTVASGRPGGKPVRKRTPAAQARFLEQMDQNDQARKHRLSEMREEASRAVQAKVLKCVDVHFLLLQCIVTFPIAATIFIELGVQR
eukprot:COSAG02_NODE_2132_length_9721_cov_44.831324_5_plen_1239_part_00